MAYLIEILLVFYHKLSLFIRVRVLQKISVTEAYIRFFLIELRLFALIDLYN